MADYIGRYWHPADDGRIICDLCPRKCALKEGQRGFCFVRRNSGGQMVLDAYGVNTGMAVDPIEKKPLYHFYPGSSVLSFGTAGCNLGCKFCQNWTISKARETGRMQQRALPSRIVSLAKTYNCRGVAFTYNDPVIFAEYAVDTAELLHREGLKTVAVTAGYISEEARSWFFNAMDAANIDLKAFTEDFYRKNCFGRLKPVLDTLKYVANETNTWLEITTLLIPGENDSPEEIDAMTAWIADNLGKNIPLHFSAFHPDFKMRDKPVTPLNTVVRAMDIAKKNGINYIYAGNVVYPQGEITRCHNCGAELIKRNWYQIDMDKITAGTCPECGTQIPGRFI